MADPTPTMTRFLKSWVEMAYPGKGQTSYTDFNHLSLLILFAGSVVQETMEKCEKTGKVMSRDSLGLPRGLGEARTPSLRGAKSPGSNVHDSRAQKKLAPVTVESPAHRKGPMTKGSSIPSSPPKFPSYPAPARFIRNHSRQPDDRGYSSVELEDSPSESLLGDLTDEEKPTFRKTQTDRGTVGGNGFRVFDKAPYDYGKFTRPITKETARSCQMKKVGWSPCQKTKTGDGMLVARGFDRPCPAKGHAMLKVSPHC